MNKRRVIVVHKLHQSPRVFTSLKKACAALGWKYNTISKKKLPAVISFEGEAVYIHRAYLE